MPSKAYYAKCRLVKNMQNGDTKWPLIYRNYNDRCLFFTFEPLPLRKSLHDPVHILQSNKLVTCARQMAIRVGLNQHLYYW